MVNLMFSTEIFAGVQEDKLVNLANAQAGKKLRILDLMRIGVHGLWNGAINERYDHIGIVTGYDEENHEVHYTHGNSGTKNYSIAAYVRPVYSRDEAAPQFKSVWIDPHDHTVLMLKAKITDDTGMGEVKAYYKRKDKADWHSEQMVPQGNDEYWLCINADAG